MKTSALFFGMLLALTLATGCHDERLSTRAQRLHEFLTRNDCSRPCPPSPCAVNVRRGA